MNHRTMTVGLLALSMSLPAALCQGQDQTSSSAPTDREVIFTIGKEDRSDQEFLSSRWTGKDEYTFRAGIDTDDKFPAELHIRGAYVSYGVVKLKITFSIEKSYGRVILRIVRGGDETSIVTVDGRQEYKVTSSMLGSAEGFRPGFYELDIGELEKGKHSLVFTVLEDGRGNGAYQWDALKLFGIAGKM